MGLFLLQPAQAPVALHAALEFGIGCIGELEIAHCRQKVGRFRCIGRCFVTQPGNQLPLVDEVDVAA
jgi:hypothetical protein